MQTVVHGFSLSFCCCQKVYLCELPTYCVRVSNESIIISDRPIFRYDEIANNRQFYMLVVKNCDLYSQENCS